MPPDNGAYMWAAYGISAVIIAAYAWTLWRRTGSALRD
jgi:heme exporter protein D